MKSKIGLIALGVCDLQKSLSFYRDGLGFTTYNYIDSEDHVMFVMEGTWLSLYPRDKLAMDATVPNDGAGFSGVTLAHNAGSREHVEAVFAQAIGSGATAVKPPQDVYWGGYHAYFADLDRYLWEVAYNPFTDLT